MTLWHCPVCSGVWGSDNRPIGCPNWECHAFLLLPVIKDYQDPLANIYSELTIKYLEIER